jgi:sulfite oxidase
MATAAALPRPVACSASHTPPPGVWLSDVLRAVGYDKATAKHVQFTGSDRPYDASIPFHKAASEDGDVLLAWEMNGEPIPREHGVSTVR